MGESSDDDLIARATTGDAGAIEGLLERYLPDLRGYLALNAAEVVLRNESVADLAQSVCREVLAHLHDGRLRFQGRAEFKQWLYRAAVLKLSNRGRFWHAAGRDQAAPDAGHSGTSSVGESPVLVEGGTPSQDAALREEVERFRKAFVQLGEDQREAIALFHVEGLSHAEIAARKGITESHSRVILARALAQLARLGAATPRAGA